MLKTHVMTSRERMPDAISIDKYQQWENPDPVFHDPVSNQKDIPPSGVHDKEEQGNLKQWQNTYEAGASEVSQEVSINLVESEKLPNNLNQYKALMM